MSIDLKTVVTMDVVRSSQANRPSVVTPAGAATPTVQADVHVLGNRQDQPESGNILPVNSVSDPSVAEAVSRLNDHVQSISRDLEFSVDRELNRVIIKVYDAETEEVIRQIPAEEVLTLARHLAEDGSVILKTIA